MYEYKVKILKVVDGDTVHVSIDFGFDAWQNHTVRLAHINAPEKNTPEGVDAKAYLDKIAENIRYMRTIKDSKEKYGRYLGVFFDSQWNNMNQAMVDGGFAVPYEGGAR